MATRPTAGLPPTEAAGESLTELFRRLAEQSEALLRQEVELAKLEIRESVLDVGKAGSGLAAAIYLAAIAGFAIFTAVLILLGRAIGSYWGSALILAGVLLLIAAILAWVSVTRLRKTAVGATATARRIQADARWAVREARELGDEVL